MLAPSARVLPERSPAVNRDSFLHNAAQLTAEREAARPRIAALRGAVSHAQDAPVPPSWRNAGFVQELITAASDMLETDARESLCMAQLALVIATSLPDSSYPLPIQAQLEASVWKEIGTAHRFLSEHDAALRAYDAALRSVRRTSVLAHDEAIIELARAVALSDMGRHDDALALIAQTAPVLHEFGDRRRLHQAALLKAIIHQRRGELAAARTTYEELVSLLEGTDDLHTLAAVYNNLGQVCIDLGQPSVALLALQHARALFEALDMPAEQTRTDWTLARILLSIGQYTNAINALQRIRAYFLSRSMSEEAALVGLDLIDASIATEQRDRAIALTDQVIAEFTAAGLNARAMTALSYLHDLVPTAAEPRRIVAHVRLYLDELRREPTRLFLPLDEPIS